MIMQWDGLTAILLFALIIPPIMQYRLLAIEGTPYWLFSLLFLLLGLNLWWSLTLSCTKFRRIKSIVLALILLIGVGFISFTSMFDRHKIAEIHMIHDIVLQQEAAIRYLIQGKNPYLETYFGTPMELWEYSNIPRSNPALYHFVMPPWYLLFPIPFYYLSIHYLGFFDGRLPLLFCLFGLLFILYLWFKNKDIGRTAIVLIAFNPATFNYFFEGRSDLFAFFWLVLSLYLLDKKRYIISGIIFAISLASKQTNWIIVPFYFIFALRSLISLKQLFKKNILPMMLVLECLFLPFIIWDPKAFFASLIGYLYGSIPHAYPISGYGWGMFLYSLGVIKDLNNYYPFIYWQIIVGLPLLVVLLIRLWLKPKISNLFNFYGIFLLVIWYFSRYFNNSHLAFISSIFILGFLKKFDEENYAQIG